jgi:RES domain-containing protein
MRVWRISRFSASDKLSGIGGLYVSGRWHARGHLVLYTSSTPSLAALEMLVHVDPALAPADLRLWEIDAPDDIALESCDPATLTPNWQDYPFPPELQDYGSCWLDACRSALLCVPSAIIPIEMNYLINPKHPDAARIRVITERPFTYDPRLLTLKS